MTIIQTTNDSVFFILDIAGLNTPLEKNYFMHFTWTFISELYSYSHSIKNPNPIYSNIDICTTVINNIRISYLITQCFL